MTITEKAAYLKGLAEGIKIEDNDNGRILKAIIDLLEDVCDEVADLEENAAEISEQVDAVDEDLANLEDYVYEEDCDGNCDDCDGCYDEEDDDLFEVECPDCHDVVYLDYDMIEKGEITCPNCGKKIELEIPECCCEDDDCQCKD